MKKKIVFLMVLIPLFLAGCIKADIGIELNDDGSGNATLLLGMDKDSPFAEGGKAQFEETIAEMEEEGYTAELIDDENFIGVKASKPFTDINEVELFNEMVGESEEKNFTIESDKSFFSTNIIIDGQLGGEDSASVEESDGVSIEGAEQLGMMMAGQFDITFTLTLPVEATEHNADRVDGNSLIWDMNVDGPTDIYVEMSKTNVMSYLLLIVPVLVLAAGAVYIIRK